MRFSFLLPVFITAFAIGGCADIMTGQSKEITVRTPGAEHAKCLLDNGTVVVPAYTDQTVRINKNYKDLTVSCAASGNRNVTEVFDLDVEPWTAGNVVTGVVPGVAYDVTSKAIYNYPDEVVINFTGLQATEYPMPQHQSADAVRAEYIAREEYMPGKPSLNSDRYKVSRSLKKVDPSDRVGNNPFLSNQERSSSQNSPVIIYGQ